MVIDRIVELWCEWRTNEFDLRSVVLAIKDGRPYGVIAELVTVDGSRHSSAQHLQDAGCVAWLSFFLLDISR